MLMPEIALRFRPHDGDGEPVVIAITSAPVVVRFVATELVREAELAAADVGGGDPVLGELLRSEVERLRLVCAAACAPVGELRLIQAKKHP